METESIIIEMYKEQMAHSRHHEVLRATVSNIIVAISAGLLGLITYDGCINTSDIPTTAFLMAVGMFGFLITMKQYQYLRSHYERANGFAEKLESIKSDTEIKKIIQDAKKRNLENFSRISKVRLNKYWGALHLIVVTIGLILLVQAIIP